MTIFRLLSLIILLAVVLNILPEAWSAGQANLLIVSQNHAVFKQGPVWDTPVTHKQRPSVLELTGLAYLRNGDSALAMQYLSLAVAARPQRITTPVFLGDAYFAMGNDNLALEAWTRADAKQVLRSRSGVAARDGDWEAVIRYLTLITQVDPRDVDAYAFLGDTYYRLGRRSEAVLAYSQAAALHSDPYQAALLEGAVATIMLDWETALSAYERAHQIAPEQAEPYYRQGCILYWGEGNLEDAARLLQIAIEIEPDDPRPYLRLVQFYSARQDYERADYWFQRGDAVIPDNWGILNQALLSQMAQKDYSQALALAERMLVLDATSDSICDLQGQALMGLGDAEQAVLAYRRAIELLPTNGVYRIHLAQALLAKGDGCEALREAELAQRLSPIMDEVIREAEAIQAKAAKLCP